MFESLIVNLTPALANEGQEFVFQAEFLPNNSLLPYPSARFVGADVDFTFVFQKPFVKVFGKITCVVEGVCDRCCEAAENVFEIPFNQTFAKEASGEYEYCYDGSKLDVSKAVFDEIVLSLPTSFLCSESCKGLCPVCGTNLNSGSCDCDRTPDNVFSVLKNLKF